MKKYEHSGEPFELNFDLGTGGVPNMDELRGMKMIAVGILKERGVQVQANVAPLLGGQIGEGLGGDGLGKRWAGDALRRGCRCGGCGDGWLGLGRRSGVRLAGA